ncbi:fimbria/pilus outer membrane usher protein [Citrobacter sp. BDA59-3]|uniref:fimbria/pilus outer membrane usher protein n=1 Tax=Citrobacter sp. BDA59-3 TaxID=2781952 RepID=UPI001882D713|nr:fimbria/pilus outer membrane usher protein [Citrobacter sp. BDA59-3]QOV69995.1 fimbrial biogenesis outer membrane usher protein [Citrobacter sp. BDA59-3]
MERSTTHHQFVGPKSRLSPLALMVMMAFPVIAAEETDDKSRAYARNVVEFESDLLRLDNGSKVDLSRFSYGSSASPGIYRVNISVNGEEVAQEEVEFKAGDNRQVYPCLTPRLIQLINFNEDKLPSEVKQALSSPATCSNLVSVIPEAKFEFDSGDQQLNIEVPQIYVHRTARGAVNPELWDSGVPALMLGYYVNGYDSQYSSGGDSRSLYASLNAGLNIGAWYFRHNGSYNWQKDIGGEYNTTNTYVQRDIAPILGRIILGEYNTSGQMFNSVPFIGAQVSSDDRMLPESQRGYAPDIRGIAKTNAKVTVKQLGNIIYETTVPPGAFLINDLYPAGYGGDLEVTIQEADGTTQQYTIAYASVAQLLRPGTQRYSMTAGKIRNTGISDEPMIYEATYMRGISNIFTGYGGVQVSENYQAYQLGLATGSRLGAIAIDATQSTSKLGNKAGGTKSGQSYRITYSKLIDETNSNITLAAYRYSTAGYMDLLTALQTRDAAQNGYDPNNIWRSKNRFTVSVNQGLPEPWGNIYLSATLENYWNSGQGYNKQYQMGYSNNWKRVNYSVNVSRSQSSNGNEQTNWYLNLSFPLWDAWESHTPYMSLRYNQDNNGGKSEQAMISGTLGDQNQYNYNLSGSHDSQSGTSANIGGGWTSSIATINGGYSTGKNYHSTSLGLSGALVAHSGGVTLTPYNSDTYALIEAKDAKGAKISGYAGTSVDRFGYALFPSLSPYQMNSVSIDPEGSSLDVEFENTAQKIAPRSGAIVKVKFNTNKGSPVLIASSFAGENLPFGADVLDESNASVGIVNQAGAIYARVREDKGTLLVKWGNDIGSSCKVSYMLAPTTGDSQASHIQQFTSPCTPVQGPVSSGPRTEMASTH